MSMLNTTSTTQNEFKFQNDRISDCANIWLDQDPGCDDAVALFMSLFSTDINVVGLTITGGNVGQKYCVKNARNLLKCWKREDIPIYVGNSLPIQKWSFSENFSHGFHGDTGLTDNMQEYFQEHHKTLPEVAGSSLLDLYNGLMKLSQKVTYIITGPATNFALLIKVFPDVMDKIERVIVMGSSFTKGNITPHAEFNTFADPESLEIVATCPLEVIVYGLEALDYNNFDRKQTQRVKEHPSPYAWMLGECYDQIHLSTFEKISKDPDFPPVCYDPGLIPSLVKKDYTTIRPVNLMVYLDGEKRGKTTYEFVEKSDYNLFAATWVDKGKFIDMLFETMDNSAKWNEEKKAIESLS